MVSLDHAAQHFTNLPFRVDQSLECLGSTMQRYWFSNLQKTMEWPFASWLP